MGGYEFTDAFTLIRVGDNNRRKLGKILMGQNIWMNFEKNRDSPVVFTSSNLKFQEFKPVYIYDFFDCYFVYYK